MKSSLAEDFMIFTLFQAINYDKREKRLCPASAQAFSLF
jgi:hypothetical protein